MDDDGMVVVWWKRGERRFPLRVKGTLSESKTIFRENIKILIFTWTVGPVLDDETLSQPKDIFHKSETTQHRAVGSGRPKGRRRPTACFHSQYALKNSAEFEYPNLPRNDYR